MITTIQRYSDGTFYAEFSGFSHCPHKIGRKFDTYAQLAKYLYRIEKLLCHYR